jgi:hypothetical protein
LQCEAELTSDDNLEKSSEDQSEIEFEEKKFLENQRASSKNSKTSSHKNSKGSSDHSIHRDSTSSNEASEPLKTVVEDIADDRSTEEVVKTAPAEFT